MSKYTQARLSAFVLVLCTVLLADQSPSNASPSSAGTPEYFNSVVDAIYLAEGGSCAKVPYGILSVKVSSKEEARRVCYNTVKNNWRRWEDAGKPGLYTDFLADRYCPKSADPQGNINWKKNIVRILK